MALQVNKELTDTTGLTIPSGSYIRFATHFSADGGLVRFQLEIFKSKSAYDEGKESIEEVEEFPDNLSKTLTETEYQSLSVTTIHEFVKEAIIANSDLQDSDIEVI